MCMQPRYSYIGTVISILIRILFVTLKSPHVQYRMPFWILLNGLSENGCVMYAKQL
jgi:hypothetical protein